MFAFRTTLPPGGHEWHSGGWIWAKIAGHQLGSTDALESDIEGRLARRPLLVRRKGAVAQEVEIGLAGLHRTFAQCSLTPASICDFADAYGMLGCGHHVDFLAAPELTEAEWRDWVKSPRRLTTTFTTGSLRGEPLVLWLWALRNVKTLVALWDLCELDSRTSSCDPELAWITAKIKGRFLLALRGEPLYDADQRPVREWRRNQRTSEPLGVDWAASSRDFVVARINAVLREHCVPVISGKRGLPPAVEAKNLLGAIYVAFALDVMGSVKQSRPCVNCGVMFTPIQAGTRYCSTKCGRQLRQRQAYRRNTGRATPQGG